MKTTKTNFRILKCIALVAVVFFYNCSEDDESTIIPDLEDLLEILAVERTEAIATLTSNNNGTWKINQASLIINGTTIDISSNFNVVDDEFVFSGTIDNGILVWKPSNAINLEGTSSQETLLDYYLEPVVSTFSFDENSSSNLTSLDGAFIFQINDDNTISGIISTSGRSQMAGTMTVLLTPKTTIDYRTLPSSGLNFSLVTSIFDESNFTGETPGGMIGSYSDNSLFLASRNDATPSGTAEQILKYDLTNNNWTTSLYPQSQFITKRLNIINNELIVFGGQIVTTYPLNPNGTPTSEFTHDLGLTRFGFAVQGDSGYIVGNSVDDMGPALVRSYDYTTNQISNITTLPSPRVYGASEIVNGELFVFGGRTYFPASLYTDLDGECFKVDLATGNISSFNMPQVATMSYAARLENLIIVGYETRTDDDGDGDIGQDNRTVHFAVYNTLDNSFTEISHNLDDSDMFSSIHAITIFNNKLYAVLAAPTGTQIELKILSAPLE
ncbi:hypothetical protein [Patiriisocius sp. Uisw_017]|uniref:hypothetical protein n=1 Tax=Patiriisocius sp. Uisw_017 TaxID=3230968 RepID=UPI0039E88532